MPLPASGKVLGALGAIMLAAALAAVPAAADLPRTYQVQRVDGPAPTGGAGFSGGVANVGDLNADGSEDFAMGVNAGSPGSNGQVFVFSGKTGDRFDTIVAPDAGGAGSAALFGIPYVGPMPDIGSCAGKTTGQLCTNPIGPKDGVPDLLIGARGIDVGGITDAGRVYVYDGATRALMKRIDMPPSDRTATGASSGGTWFGRVAVVPTGLPPCAGNGGVGTCTTMPTAVRIGDLDSGGAPDIVVGASRYTENDTTAYPTSNCARTAGATCIGAGRAYVYRGEDVAGTDPNAILATPLRRFRNLAAQADNPSTVDPTARRELFANAISPVGDIGVCTTPGVVAGDRCGASGTSTVPDGRPEVLISAFRVDLPVENPDPAFVDVGVNFLIDGATGAILYTYQHPQPQAGAVFGSAVGGPPVGDLGDTPLPDVYLSAVTQDGQYQAEGRGYVMTGNLAAFSSTINFSLLNDPTPAPSGNFGGGYSAVGNLVNEPGKFRNEVLVGQGHLGEPGNADLLSDVHFFDPLKAQPLQSIADPDQNPGGRFGSDIITLGDLNGDGFLDFAVGAASFNGPAGPNQGRLYIFRSDNSPAPSAPSPGAQSPGELTATGSTIALDATAPAVSRFGVTNSPFVVGGGPTPTFGRAARHRKGTMFTYTLSEAATVRVVIAQRRPGRRQGSGCVAPRPSLRRKARCIRFVPRGTLTRISKAGANRVGFSGRIGSRALGSGTYTATITATDAAKNTSKPKTISFAIVKR